MTKQAAKANNTAKLRVAQAVWTQTFGTDFSDLAFPSALGNGILTIAAATPAVIFAIEQQWRTVLLEELRCELGQYVRDIKCVLQPTIGGPTR